MPLEILDKFSHHLKAVLTRAINLAIEKKQTQISPLLLLHSLLQEKGALATDLLYKCKLTPHELGIYVTPTSAPIFLPEFSKDSRKVIEKAALTAQQWKHQYIGTEHLLLSLLELNNPQINQVFRKKGTTLEQVKKQLNGLLKNTSQLPQITSLLGDDEEEDLENSKTPALDFFGTNLTDQNNQKKIDPVIGRENEIERLIHILSRRTKNNPVLIGEPGVGKTAIVEGLAKRVLEKKVPHVLLEKIIYKLDLSLVIAGTMYRGEFESRFKQIIDEVQNNPDIIIFIDEIHTLMGAGSAGGGGQSGAMDAANILKPALAKGELRCIGATTLEEYRKHIESDAALERRFQSILVEESSTEETLEILQGVKENYEHYHQVTIQDSALQAAVNLSTRYLQDKFLPDKAIDLIDEAAAKAKVNKPVSPEDNIAQQLKEKIENVKEKKQALIKAEKLEQALALKEKEKELQQQLKKIQSNQSQKQKKYKTKITERDVAAIISKITGLPLGELIAAEKNKVLDLEKNLNQHILGQAAVTKDVASFIKRARAGLSSPHRPLGSFIFLGPSGVGKTELAKVLAKTLFGDDKSLLRIDMSEFKESFNVSKLIGAPAGYVGYKEGAKLSDFVKRKPYSVILFDEIEKAHPDTFNILLQILEDGHLTDATGKKINFKNTIIIMTSNIGLKDFLQQAEIGFADEEKVKAADYEKIKTHVLKELKKGFRPEFLNRIDKICVFKPLTQSTVTKIANLHIEELKERLAEKDAKIKLSPAVYKWLAEKSFSPEEGARALRRIIQEKIETPLAEKILEEDLKPGTTIKVGIKKDVLTFS